MSTEHAEPLYMPHHGLSPILFGGRRQALEPCPEARTDDLLFDADLRTRAYRAGRLLFNYSKRDAGSEGLLEQLTSRIDADGQPMRELAFMARNYRLIIARKGAMLAHRRAGDVVIRSGDYDGLAMHMHFNHEEGVKEVTLIDESASVPSQHPCFVAVTADVDTGLPYVRGFMDGPGDPEHQFELPRQRATSEQLLHVGNLALHLLTAEMEPDNRASLVQ